MTCTSFNKTIIIGKVASDPEYLEAGEGRKIAVAKFTIYDSALTEDVKERLNYHRICAFGNQASLVHKHILKGDICCVEGRLDSRIRKNDGKAEVIIAAERITSLSSRRKTEE